MTPEGRLLSLGGALGGHCRLEGQAGLMFSRYIYTSLQSRLYRVTCTAMPTGTSSNNNSSGQLLLCVLRATGSSGGNRTRSGEQRLSEGSLYVQLGAGDFNAS